MCSNIPFNISATIAHAHLPQAPFQKVNSCQAVLILTLASLTSQVVEGCQKVPTPITLQDTNVIR